jgi:hypothetical protein
MIHVKNKRVTTKRLRAPNLLTKNKNITHMEIKEKPVLKLSLWSSISQLGLLLPIDSENRKKVALILTCYTSVYLQWAHNWNTYNPCTMAGWHTQHGYGKYTLHSQNVSFATLSYHNYKSIITEIRINVFTHIHDDPPPRLSQSSIIRTVPIQDPLKKIK